MLNINKTRKTGVAKQYLLLKSDLVFARELLCESVVGRGYCLENKSNFVWLNLEAILYSIHVTVKGLNPGVMS